MPMLSESDNSIEQIKEMLAVTSHSIPLGTSNLAPRLQRNRFNNQSLSQATLPDQDSFWEYSPVEGDPAEDAWRTHARLSRRQTCPHSQAPTSSRSTGFPKSSRYETRRKWPHFQKDVHPLPFSQPTPVKAKKWSWDAKWGKERSYNLEAPSQPRILVKPNSERDQWPWVANNETQSDHEELELTVARG